MTSAGLKKTHNTHFFIRNGAGRFHEDTAMDPGIGSFLQGGARGPGKWNLPYLQTLPEQDSTIHDHYPWTG